ncbi:MAG: isoamylase early set domain-containing protein [Nitrospirae bacterium]|nr:isoamylase early set domain-containing protein [Nitrospirota bacterium]
MKTKPKSNPGLSASANKKKSTALSKKEVGGRIKKQYLKGKPECKVTFKLPKEAAANAKSVSIVGDFNGWDANKSPMKRLKNGDFTVNISLPCNNEYRFRYLINNERWENDWFADKYIPNCFGCDDSVVVV